MFEEYYRKILKRLNEGEDPESLKDPNIIANQIFSFGDLNKDDENYYNIKENAKLPISNTPPIIKKRGVYQTLSNFLEGLQTKYIEQYLPKDIDTESFNSLTKLNLTGGIWDVYYKTDAEGDRYIEIPIYLPKIDEDTTDDQKFYYGIMRKAMKEFIHSIPKLFGTHAGLIQVGKQGFMTIPIVVFLKSDSKTVKKPNIIKVISRIFNTYDIKGLGFDYIDKVNTGYRIKLQGLKIVDDNTFINLEKDLRQTLGDKFIKLTSDKGELKNIGHRPVAQGLTNYRIWLTPNVWESFARN